MRPHASAEVLSAYLDRQLVGREVRQLERHLESCEQCNVRLSGLRRVVSSLQDLNPIAPPSTLEQAVVRRIALTEERPSLLDRFEESLSLLNRQNPLLAMFGVVIALILFIFLFSYSLHLKQDTTIPVIFVDDPPMPEGTVGSRSLVAGRHLTWSLGGVWVEDGLSAEALVRSITIDSQDGIDFFAAHPELVDLASLGRSVVIAVDGEAIRLD